MSRNQTGKDQPEVELIDTDAFDDDRYFDVFVEYVKADAEDIHVKVTVHNRGPEATESAGFIKVADSMLAYGVV
ncbi:hypothetical protein [Adhaeretor mobilis]|uniref:hypothetical protein n=1 Tax=Adhaeretor mobilis TaxID=1930276 RepID=UPI0011AAD386|nr:hypothetical protein [Adhaeretor mobilis]